jgi:hypothetical protein
MPTPEALLAPVIRAADALLASGDGYHGLMPSLLDRQTGKMLDELPQAIPGQRLTDRAHLGCNLIHDEAFLQTCYALSRHLGEPRFAAGADRYLHYFATHCAGSASGLFPWGEHSFWHLREHRIGDSYQLGKPQRPLLAIHDHLRQAPLWLWQKLHHYQPAAVAAFSEGQQYHWSEPNAEGHCEYMRHAPITQTYHYKTGPRACDFPRHSGFYLFNYAFAASQEARPVWLAQMRRYLDYWWQRRDATGLLLLESRSPANDPKFFNVLAPGQTLSLGTSLIEGAALLERAGVDPELSQIMRQRAAVYLKGFLAAPHDPANGRFLISFTRGASTGKAMPLWGSEYGVWPAAYVGLTALRAATLTGDPALRAWGLAVATAQRATPPPAGLPMPAMDAGLALQLFAEAFVQTGDERWLADGRTLAGQLLPLFFEPDRALPRGAAGIDWYESQMGPGFLLHGLARLALLTLHGAAQCPLAGNYTAR